MNNLLKVSLLVVPFLAAPATAHAWGGCDGPCGSGCHLGPLTVDFGFHWNYRIGCGGCGQAGPWYLYWPYLAHFSAPAPVGGCYPNGPGPAMPGGMVAFPAAGIGNAPAPAVPSTPPTGIQPTSHSAPVPAYWYNQ
jgi:hypothetical protein